MIRVVTRCSIQACCSGVKAGAAGGAAGVVGNAGVSGTIVQLRRIPIDCAA